MPTKLYNEKDASRLSPDTEYISARGLADEDVHLLYRFDRLRFLSFGIGALNLDAKITDQGIKHLAQKEWPELECLQLDMNWNITDAGIETLATMKAPKLDVLVLSENPNITDEGLRHLARMDSLGSLNLSVCPNITDEGLKCLARASSLHWLALDQCNGITDVGVSYLIDNPKLKTIYLAGCKNVSPEWKVKYPQRIVMKLDTYTGAGADKYNAMIDEILEHRTPKR